MAAINFFKNSVKFLILFAPLSAWFSANSSAEEYAVAQTYLHNFNNGVQVYTGVFGLNKDISLQTSTYFKYNIDLINPSWGEDGEHDDEEGDEGAPPVKRVAAVSGASSAVTAGGSAFSDTRHELMAGITHNFDNIIGVEAYYDYSKEKDYLSNTPTVTLKKDLFEKNTTLTFGYSRNFDTIHGQFMDSEKNRDTDNFFFGITQIISPFTVAQIGYSRNISRGFESEGIRLVPLNNTPQSSCTAKSATCVDEVFPDSRTRNAYIIGISHYFLNGFALFDRSSIRLNLRYYKDTWDINSYTTEVEYYKYLFGENLVLRLNYRYYEQTQASFVKDIYTGTEEFMSSSPQLLAFNSNLAGVKLAYNLSGARNSSGFRLGSIEGKYEYYRQSIHVDAHVLMAGIRLLF